MKNITTRSKYHFNLIVALVFLFFLIPLASCTSNIQSVAVIDKPLRRQYDMVIVLYNYFFSDLGYDKYWARPIFPINDKWIASYNNNGVWLVKAYDIDNSLAGEWLVPESVYFSKDYSKIKPNDDMAKQIVTSPKKIAQMPPLPPFLRISNIPREDMITAVQQYIAKMSVKEANDNNMTDIQRAILKYYFLKWYVSYTSSSWVVIADYDDLRATSYINPSTGKMTVSGESVQLR